MPNDDGLTPTISAEDHVRVAYIWSAAMQEAADALPANLGRSSMVHELIHSLNLLNVPRDSPMRAGIGIRGSREEGHCARVVAPDMQLGDLQALRRYHDAKYVDTLMNQSNTAHDLSNDDHSDTSNSSLSSSGREYGRKRRKIKHHGLEHDCPTFPELAQYAQQIAASTSTACRLLARNQADITINWDGGRHHAMRNKASGFCYVADIVLGIMLLAKEGIPRGMLKGPDGSEAEQKKGKTRRPRIMYLDLDLHCGDGVAQAFLSPSHYLPAYSDGKRPPRPPQVLTLSIHHSSPIFFPPPTPLSTLPSADTPHPFTLSLPLAAYTAPPVYARMMRTCVEPVMRAFDPDYVVLQLGVDGLPGDEVGKWGGWGTEGEGGVRWCAERVKSWGRGLCVLGGGGYQHANAARAWALATSELLGRNLTGDVSVPHHDHFPAYGPSYTLEVEASHVRDENTLDQLDSAEKAFSHIAQRILSIIAAHASAA